MQHFQSNFTWMQLLLFLHNVNVWGKSVYKVIAKLLHTTSNMSIITDVSMSSFSWSETIASTKEPTAMTRKSLCFGADDLSCIQYESGSTAPEDNLLCIYFYWTCNHICFHRVYPNLCIYVSPTLSNPYPSMFEVCCLFSFVIMSLWGT